ncbi:MAG: LysM peptidoglycan-binding domain-containing protein [Anaerolineae bacterium]
MKRVALLLLAIVLSLAVPSGALAAPPGQGPVTHVVQPGESLSSIAMRYGVNLVDLAHANGLTTRSWVYTGQVLQVPGVVEAAAAARVTPGSVHVVQRGETLASIAWRYGVTVDQLVQANGLPSSHWIYVGQRLVVPGAASAGATQVAVAPLGGVHVVQPGESLSSIAARYGLSVWDLARANNLSVLSWVYVGQQLALPSAAGGQASAQAEVPSGGAVHVVRPGETLAGIAWRYGVTVDRLVQANGLRSANLIYVGQQLRIPGAQEALAAQAAPATGQLAEADTPGEKWIEVDLSSQTLTAYAGSTPVYSAVVSTGLPRTPTVTGEYRIYAKYRSAPMSGPGYYLPNVPYIMYFHRGYALHGTYWHNSFGQPMSHGCVNLRTSDAEWLYHWAPVGTLVRIHP